MLTRLSSLAEPCHPFQPTSSGGITIASDAYMELETQDVIGETRDQRFGMDSQKARSEGAFEISDISVNVTGAHSAADSHTTIPNRNIKKAIDSDSCNLFLLCCKK